MASGILTVAALGRPFTLGMLYDARKEDLLPGFTLWDDATLQKRTVQTSQHSSTSQVSTSDSINSKSSLLDINASLKASFMSGLVEVGGSAKYMNSTNSSKKESRVTFKYNATHHFKQLSMSDMMTMSDQQREIIKRGNATHVVTGILYGANGFFVFDCETSEKNSSQDISGKMEAVIKKIPCLDIEGEISGQMTSEENALTEKFSCTFYGDLILEKDPVTFVEAVKTFEELPKLLGESGENCVPLKVWLVPLRNLEPAAAEMSSTISLTLLKELHDALENLREIGMRCNDALAGSVAENFPQIRKKLQCFQDLCGYHETDIKRTVAEKLPLIREGKEGETSLNQFFEVKAKSPFSSEKLHKWMDDAEREINVIRSILEFLKGAPIFPNKSELDRVILNPNTEPGICYAFTSLDSPDPRLDAMTRFLKSMDAEITDEDLWYYSDDVVNEMRDLARQLDPTSGRVLISAIATKDVRGACWYDFMDGKLHEHGTSADVEKVLQKMNLTVRGYDPDTAN